MKVIYNDGHVAECPEDEELHVIRHTAAHVLAQAVKRVHPGADLLDPQLVAEGEIALGDLALLLERADL